MRLQIIVGTSLYNEIEKIRKERNLINQGEALEILISELRETIELQKNKLDQFCSEVSP